MASIQPVARHYPAAHLKQLMDSMNGQARTWDDVLDYLQSRKAGTALPDDELPELIRDVRHLKEDNVHFTTDYREMWKELTGESVDNLPLEAETRNASSRVLDVLRRVESKEYKAMAARMDDSDDAGWLGRH